MELQGRNLSLRMQGEDVALLHRELQQLGFTIAESEVATRSFGESTREAVTRFQRQQGLEPTGVVDERTAARISIAPPRPPFVVNGQIRQQDGQAVANVLVRAFDQDLRREELLGETVTAENGAYEIPYTAEQFARAEKQSADLVVRAFSPDGVPLAASDTLFNAPAKARIDLVITPPEQPLLSEYEQLLAELSPLLQDIPLAELTEEDIDFLVGETSLERQRIEFLAQAAKLGRDTDLATEVFYGFARQGLPLELDVLLTKDLADLRNALESAIDNNIIPAKLRESLDEIMARLEQLRLERGTIVTYEFFGQLLDQETDTALSGYTVQAFDLEDGPEPKDLGFDISNANGLFTVSYTAPRLEAPAEDDETVPMRRLRLQITDAQGAEIHQTEIQAKIGEAEVVEIRVPLPAVPEPPSPRVQELDSTLQLQIPPGIACPSLRPRHSDPKRYPEGRGSQSHRRPAGPPGSPGRANIGRPCQPRYLVGRFPYQ